MPMDYKYNDTEREDVMEILNALLNGFLFGLVMTLIVIFIMGVIALFNTLKG